jgi:oligopeptide transport system substrate-binding protein
MELVKRKFFVMFAILALLTLGIYSAFQDHANSTRRSAAKSVFKLSLGEAPNNFDPARAGIGQASFVLLNVYDTLYRYQYLARPYELAPNLADRLPSVSADGLTYTIHIRSGRRFADDPAFANGRGREVTAYDVAYSLLRHFDPQSKSSGSWLWSEVLPGAVAWGKNGANYAQPPADIEVVDDHTVRLHLSAPMAALPMTLTSAFAAIVPREAVTHYGVDFALHPVGSGPYRLRSFADNVARLEKNLNYDGERISLQQEGYDAKIHQAFGLAAIDGRTMPLTDELEFHYIASPQTQWAALQSQDDMHMGFVPPNAQDGVLQSRQPLIMNAAYTEQFSGLLSAWNDALFVSFNMRDADVGAAADPQIDERHRKLRCAISTAYDWPRRDAQFYGGTSAQFSGVIPPLAQNFEASRLIRRGADLTLAKQLLRDGGYQKDNLPIIRYASTGGVEMQAQFELFRGFLLELGWPVEKIQWQPFAGLGAFNEAVNAGNLMMMDMGWSMDYPDALNILQLYFGPYAAPQVNNANYNNPAFNQLFQQAMRTQNGPVRSELIKQMNDLIEHDCVAISGISRNRFVMWRKQFIAYPDFGMLGGYFLRFVAERAP